MQADWKQKHIKVIMKKIINDFFKDEDNQSEGKQKQQEFPKQLNVLELKLQTLMFLEIALVMNENIDSSHIQFYFYCAYNMALKSQSVLIRNDDLESWIRAQRSGKSLAFWNHHIFSFEEFVFRKLNWNTDLVTPASILQYFEETHFQELQYNKDFSQKFCEADILSCFIKQKWSNSSIALGCLAYQLQQLQDTQPFEYLIFLINHYSTQLSIFDFTEISDVFSHLSEEANQISKPASLSFGIFPNIWMEADDEDLNNLSPIQSLRSSQSTQASKQSIRDSPVSESQKINRKRKFSASICSTIKHSKQLFSQSSTNDLNDQEINSEIISVSEEIQKKIKRKEDQSIFQISS